MPHKKIYTAKNIQTTENKNKQIYYFRINLYPPSLPLSLSQLYTTLITFKISSHIKVSIKSRSY